MIVYLIKAIACSAILIAIYHLFLEKEKMLQFNRAYLLVALPLSFCIPLLTLDLTSTSPVVQNLPFLYQEIELIAQPEVAANSEFSTTQTSYLPTILVSGYLLVCALFSYRFFNNLSRIVSAIGLHSTRQVKNSRLVIMDQPIIPHTFLHYIFIGTEDIENENILVHELTHSNQKHTLDILFIELIQCLFWINPLIFFYKKAIKLNHEFIADEAVINSCSEPAEYQQLLLAKVCPGFQSSLISSFSYALTKKRFIMMTTAKNLKRSAIKITLSLLLVCSVAFLFSEKSYSQVTDESKSTIASDTVRGVSPEMVSEFGTSIDKYVVKKNDSENIVINLTGISENERVRMKEIYDSMTPEQKAHYPKGIMLVFTPTPPPTKKSPTLTQLTAWKDSKLYGVWLDGKRIGNEELEKFKPSELSFYIVSKLLKNAAHYGQYKYHVDLMTDAHFDKTYPPKSN